MGKRSRSAFSLLEVVVASFIFLATLGAFQAYFVTTARMMENSRARMAASFVAEQLLEDFLAKGYARADEIPTSGTVTLDVTMYGKPRHFGISYKVTIVDVSDELKSVLINVSSNETKAMQFETLLCKLL